MGKAIRVGLLWHSRVSGNLGVGALTLANIAIAREVAQSMGLDVEFRIFGMRESGVQYLDEHEVADYQIDIRRLLAPGGYWKALGEQDCMLDIGAGDSFAEIYGMKRFGFLWLTKRMANWRRKPLILSPQTIGPFSRQPYLMMARSALTAARTVVARDQLSLDACRKLAPRANALLSVDVAFALPFENMSHLRGGDRVRVGLNVSGLLFNEAESGRNKFGLDLDYAAFTRRLIADLTARADVELHLITHANHGKHAWDDDGRVADKLAAEFPAAIRAPDFAGPSQAKSYISGLDFLVAGRMHACIAAFSSGTPVVPVAYSRKFSGLFGLLRYPHLIGVSGTSTDMAIEYVKDRLAQRAAMAQDCATGMAQVEELLSVYKLELRKLFSSVEGRT